MAGSTFWGVGYAVSCGYVRAPRAVRDAAGALKPARTPVNARRGGVQGNDGGTGDRQRQNCKTTAVLRKDAVQ